jgi:hypothetical protein
MKEKLLILRIKSQKMLKLLKKYKIMKKVYVLGLFLIAISLFLSACNLSKNQADNLPGKQRKERMPDFGQPESNPDVSGIVKSITGNEVTILKIDFPGSGQKESNSEQDKEKNNTRAIGVSTGGGMRGGPGMMGGGRQNQDEASKKEMLEKIKEMSTGEETITIPVGIQMLKPDIESEQKTPQMAEASLSDISLDKMIRVWLDAGVTDKKVASFVMITK